jgi:unsaturated rhamnogalacturonyl hydrolase
MKTNSTARRFMFAAVMVFAGVCGPGVPGAAAQQTTAGSIPDEIAPIKAPFEMPQLKRPVFADRTFDIRDFGAAECRWEDAQQHKSTEAIRRAIEACSKAGGGTVLIPEGQWLTGAIHLKSHIHLHIAEGAIVHFSNDLEDYLPLVHVRYEGVEAYNYSPLIYAPHVENIAVTGKGTLHGHGRWWWQWGRDNDAGNREQAAKLPLEQRRYGKGAGREGMRPSFIVPWKARNVLIEGITLKESPMWNVHPVYSENIIVHSITVHSLESPNGDGIVPDSCKNVLIEYNHLETGDDAVVIKSGLNEDGLKIGIPSENIVIRNFTAREVRTGSGGVVFGSETSGGIRNVFVYNALFDGSDRGIRFKSTRGRGNVVENIFIENVQMKNITRQAINFNTAYAGGIEGGPPPRFRNVYLNNIRVDGAATAIELIGLPEMWLENINIRNAVFNNVRNGAVVRRVKALRLDDVAIHTEGRPVLLDNAAASFISHVKLSGRQPLVYVQGAESSAIIIDGLASSEVECAEDVPEKAIGFVELKLPMAGI